MDQPTILIIDDEEATRYMLRHLLEQAGYRIRTARDGVEGLGLLAQEKPSLILLDVHMPWLDGKKVVQILQSRQVAAPIILMSSDYEVPTWATALGAYTFVPKPLDLDHLQALVQRLLPPTSS